MHIFQRFFSLFILLPLALVVIVFALLNRDPVVVDLFVAEANLPLYIGVLGALAIGFLTGIAMGSSLSWFSQGKWRRRARKGERRATSLEHEVEELRRAEPSTALPKPAKHGLARRALTRTRSVLQDD